MSHVLLSPTQGPPIQAIPLPLDNADEDAMEDGSCEGNDDRAASEADKTEGVSAEDEDDCVYGNQLADPAIVQFLDDERKAEEAQQAQHASLPVAPRRSQRDSSATSSRVIGSQESLTTSQEEHQFGKNVVARANYHRSRGKPSLVAVKVDRDKELACGVGMTHAIKGEYARSSTSTTSKSALRRGPEAKAARDLAAKHGLAGSPQRRVGKRCGTAKRGQRDRADRLVCTKAGVDGGSGAEDDDDDEDDSDPSLGGFIVGDDHMSNPSESPDSDEKPRRRLRRRRQLEILEESD
eukprot:3938005-Rhodomonas_salina.1